MFAEWANKTKGNIKTEIGILNNKLQRHKHEDSFISSDTKKSLESTSSRFVGLPITGNIALIVNNFMHQ